MKIKLLTTITYYLLVGCSVTIGLTLLSCTSLAISGGETAQVSKVVDGDQVYVTMSNCRWPQKGNQQVCQIRLACIDAPQKKDQSFYQASKQRLAQLIPPGTTVMVRDTGDSSYNRIVGEIYADNQSVNLLMVREGLAKVSRKHINKQCPGAVNSYLSAEEAAKKESLGIWKAQK
jgi:micrococcal nuclease